tara:strand:+ start:812 stop:1420 length:609 start_codon:yes stop_codon:yes gene_type:complete
MAGMAGEPPDDMKVTIRKPASQTTVSQPDPTVFVAKFSHVKPALSTFLKFWLMGGCGELEGWAGTGELEALHSASGTTSSILVDAEQSTVSLTSPSAASSEGNPALNEYAIALLDELETLAKTEDAPTADRLCYPPEAVDSIRFAAWAACAPREYDTAIGAAAFGSGEQDAPAAETTPFDPALETEFDKFLREIKEKEARDS